MNSLRVLEGAAISPGAVSHWDARHSHCLFLPFKTTHIAFIVENFMITYFLSGYTTHSFVLVRTMITCSVSRRIFYFHGRILLHFTFTFFLLSDTFYPSISFCFARSLANKLFSFSLEV